MSFKYNIYFIQNIFLLKTALKKFGKRKSVLFVKLIINSIY